MMYILKYLVYIMNENVGQSGENMSSDDTTESIEKQEKVDIKKLLSVVPPPAALFSKQKQGIREKRIRLRYDQSVKADEAKISSSLARELGIREYVEISVTGKKRFRLKAVISDSIPPDVVYINPEPAKRFGISDNSICTIRAV